MDLQGYVDELVALDGVQFALLSLRNGLLAASRSTLEADENTVAAVTAAAFDAMNRYLGEADLGTVVDTIMETSKYSVQMMGLDELIMVVIAQKRMSVKDIRLHMRRIARELAEGNA